MIIYCSHTPRSSLPVFISPTTSTSNDEPLLYIYLSPPPLYNNTLSFPAGFWRLEGCGDGLTLGLWYWERETWLTLCCYTRLSATHSKHSTSLPPQSYHPRNTTSRPTPTNTHQPHPTSLPSHIMHTRHHPHSSTLAPAHNTNIPFP